MWERKYKIEIEWIKIEKKTQITQEAKRTGKNYWYGEKVEIIFWEEGEM